MEWLIPLAAKSLLIAGGALLLLKLLKDRSAADRSWIAHLALAGLLLLPLAAFLPTLDVTGPEFLVGTGEVQAPASSVAPEESSASAATAAPAVAEAAAAGSPVDWTFWAYAVPAAMLVLIILVALGRLFVLKSRATVLVDAPWLTALARAQQRMGFKHGTALLTSNDLPSPISWGVVRPVILLNRDASQSHAEAEAIITHELAHVAHLDWAKLLIARVATALFWFNPFVWLLAREAHQLREEAADDAVLATDIEETDYARLLVGVARHECRGFLIGAHGVAPGRNSLSRRVKRVLDGAVKRAKGGWRWGSAVAFFAAGMAVPVAALNLVPAASANAANEDVQLAQVDSPYYSDSGEAEPPHSDAPPPIAFADDGMTLRSQGSTITTEDGETVLRSSDGSLITIAAADDKGRRRTVLRSSDGSTLTFADARAVPGLASAIASPPLPPLPPRPPRMPDAVESAIAMKAVGATPEYVASIRAAAPHLHLDGEAITALKAVGVTAPFLRELSRLGYRHFDAEDASGAYAVGVRADYVRSLASAGYRGLSLEDLTAMKAVGVTAADIDGYRRAGFHHLDAEKLVQLKAMGVTPEELKASDHSGP